MYSLLKNSFIVLLISFVLLCLIFYLFKIGYTKQFINGKIVKKFSWKYPLAISLIIWLIWHFYLYPPPPSDSVKNNSSQIFIDQPEKRLNNNLNSQIARAQRINMINWN